MDDDSQVDMMNDKMKDLKMLQAMTPSGHNGTPLKRTDTETSDVEAFFDA